MLKAEFRHFLSNPIFFIEASRILSGISKIVSIRPFPKIGFEFDFCRANGLKIVVLETRISRILSNAKFSESRILILTRDERFAKRLISLEKRILNGKLDFEKGRRKLIMLEGKLFGYPDCCSKAYAKSKTSLPLETKLIIDAIERGIFSQLILGLRKSQILSFPQFFTLNFYPCEADCKRAERVGLKIKRSLGEFGFVFSLRTMLNALYLLRIAYKSAHHSGILSKVAREFLKTLKKEELEMIEAVAEVDYEEFSNNFIRSLMKRYYDRSGREHNSDWDG